MNGAVRLLVLGAILAAVILGAARGWATPGTGVVGPIVARGSVADDVVLGTPQNVTLTRRVTVRVGGKAVTRRVKVTVPTVQRLMTCGGGGTCDIAFQQLTFSPGAHTGWHTHPGPTFVAVAQGEGTLYHGMAGCPAHKYGPGTAFFQPSSEVHTFRNEGSVPLVIYAFYALPAGTPNTAIRTDQPQPASCPNIP
jgi:mannose-6-phosphate isomerase-like protein (cupin superfamily)